MPRGPYPALLMLAMSLPGAARALGLGDIRINSALNEPLSAQIDLMGATPEELQTLTAQLADEAMFQRYGADRPSYLSTVRFKVATDSKGRPVLEVHSAAPFADPIVNFLVDIRWPKGELVRDYSLLLDPVVFAPENRAAAAPAITGGLADLTPVSLSSLLAVASPAPATQVSVATAIPAPSASRIESAYRVLARDTLFGIVRRAGAVTEADVQQMMIAVFRANPEAFDRNINLLRRGALLNMPSASDVAAVDAAEARRAVAGQMRAWKLYSVGADFHPVGSGLIALPPSAQRPVESAAMETLNSRVQLLEVSLEAERQQVASMKATIQELRQPPPVPVAKAPTAAIKPAPTPIAARLGARIRASLLSSRTLLLGLPLVGLLILAARRRRSVATALPAREPRSRSADLASVEHVVSSTAAIQSSDADQLNDSASTVEMQAPDADTDSPYPEGEEDTVTMEADTQLMEQLEADYASAEGSAAGATVRIGTANDTAEMATAIIAGTATDAVVLSAVAEQVAVKRLHTTVLDYNLVDLDSKAPHVHMPSELNDRQVNVERRTSVVDALRAAIKRDPQRPDLCMKLLETYQGTAAANRRAFEEFALLQAREPGSLSVEDWRKIVALGHEIGLDLGFLVEKAEDDLAHCA